MGVAPALCCLCSRERALRHDSAPSPLTEGMGCPGTPLGIPGDLCLAMLWHQVVCLLTPDSNQCGESHLFWRGNVLKGDTSDSSLDSEVCLPARIGGGGDMG